MISPSTCTTFLLPFSMSMGREVPERAEARMKTTKNIFPEARGRGSLEKGGNGNKNKTEMYHIEG